jgi:beta-galactosidase
MKDQDNSLWPQRQPVPLADLLGARVEQYYALNKPVPLAGQWGSAKASVWADQHGITSPDTQVLMRYGPSNGWLDGQPAAVTRRIGNGSITYIGTDMDDAAMKQAMSWMLAESGVSAIMQDVPPEVDVAIRSGEGKRIMILTNYGLQMVTIQLPEPMEDALHEKKVTSISLPRYGVSVLK